MKPTGSQISRLIAAARQEQPGAVNDLLAVLDSFVAGEGSSPSYAYQQRERAVILADALAELSPDHREVIVLRSIQELDWDEVADKMGRSRNAVRVLWARALKQLRKHIQDRL